MNGFLADFRFAAPEWGGALWGVLALVAFLGWRSRRDDQALSSLIAPSLQAALLRRASPARRALEIALLGMACAAFVLALQIALILTHWPWPDEYQAVQLAVQAPDILLLPLLILGLSRRR